MNIFFLSLCPEQAAIMQCDKHVVKMILETAQLLSTAFRLLAVDHNHTGIYKISHVNHPTAKWVRSSKENCLWTIRHGLELSNEYSRRYNGKEHKSRVV